MLAEKVGLRPDIPPRLFRDLLLKATEVVQQRLFASARPETQAEIRACWQGLRRGRATPAPRDYSQAQRTIEELRRSKLDEAALVDFAKGRKYEETIAALASLCSVPIDVVDRLMGGDRPIDPHPLQVGRLRLADRQSRHHGTAERQGTVEPGARHRLFQFRAAVAGDRATRDAVLAIAEDRASSE